MISLDIHVDFKIGVCQFLKLEIDMSVSASAKRVRRIPPAVEVEGSATTNTEHQCAEIFFTYTHVS